MRLDDRYRLQNNSINGVELVFEETRQKKSKKDDSLQDYQFIETWYYPNPILAIKKWISLTSANVQNLDELINLTSKIDKTLDKIYEEFKNNKYKL